MLKEFKPEMPVRYLKGVGPRSAEKLSTLGIATLKDLIRYYPRAWEDRRCLKKIREAKPGDALALRGVVKDFNFIETPRGFAIAKARLADDSGALTCKWTRRRSFKYDVLQIFRKMFQKDQSMIVFGRVDFDQDGKSISVEESQVLNGQAQPLVHLDRIVPVYPATEGISVPFLRKLIYDALPKTEIPDPLPSDLQSHLNLMPLRDALQKIHFPKTMQEAEQARARLAFEELFMIQTVFAIARRRRKVPREFHYQLKKNLLTPFREACGFEFTKAQKRVIREIFSDMAAPHPMNRLLQGDVGSGKTVVAIAAMLLACENDCQSVLMAPTEILAEQHYITLKQYLKGLPVTFGLLTGSVQGKAKEQFKEGCASGKLQIAVGTHALLEDDIRFDRLGLAVIDEQHRFGVRHRLSLTRRKPAPDTLIMTATPIPRTLALGIYGDLDVSTLDQLPPGRQKIVTALTSEAEAFKILSQEIEKGHQTYIVCPLIDETKSERIAEEKGEGEILPAFDLDSAAPAKLKAAVQQFDRLAKIFKGKSLGLLHGRLDRKDKEKVMMDFKDGKYDILVSTTVIEVGVDVPNCTVMVVENAERFGLSTLHQLRGRVGRGQDPSVCLLIAQPRTEISKRRLEIMAGSQSGFHIAEEDLKLRGPGEIFGTSQHGLPPLKIADFNSDLEILKKARLSAQTMIEQDPDLSGPKRARLRDHLRAQFSGSWFLANTA